jgi:hypothetical protein
VIHHSSFFQPHNKIDWEGELSQVQCWRSLLPALHPGLLKEIVHMARSKAKWPNLDLGPLVEWMGGMEEVIKQLGMERVIHEVGVKRVIDEVGLDELVASLSPTQRRALKRRLDDR